MGNAFSISAISVIRYKQNFIKGPGSSDNFGPISRQSFSEGLPFVLVEGHWLPPSVVFTVLRANQESRGCRSELGPFVTKPTFKQNAFVVRFDT